MARQGNRWSRASKPGYFFVIELSITELDREKASNLADKRKATFFDILKMNHIDTIVDHREKKRFERSTILCTKNAMFVKVNPLKMNSFF